MCRKKGVEVDKYGDLGYFSYPIWLLAIIFKAMYKFNKSMQVYTTHAASEGSIVEMKGNFMDVYESGKALGVPMPHMEKLVRLVKDRPL